MMNIISDTEQNVLQRREQRIPAGALIGPRELRTIDSRAIRIPDAGALVHLQFRRFAGCPVCDLHLRALARRIHELQAARIREVVVFYSTAEELLRYAGDLPFAIIADPGKRLYAEFGLESKPSALLDPRAWPAIVRGVAGSSLAILRRRIPVPPLRPSGGSLGLPADFMISPDGRIVACKYGVHAYDQWTAAEILALAYRAAAPASP